MWTLNQRRLPNEPYGWAKNIFTPDECEYILNLSKSFDVEDGKVDEQGDVSHDVRRSKISWIRPTPQTEFIFVKIEDALLRVNDAIFQYTLTEIEDIQFSEYHSNYQGMYASHVDDGYDATNRKLSFSILLSDPASYEGGDLLLYRYSTTRSVNTHKEQGMMTVFPSSTVHEVTPVTKGVRYTLVGWAHGPQFR